MSLRQWYARLMLYVIRSDRRDSRTVVASLVAFQLVISADADNCSCWNPFCTSRLHLPEWVNCAVPVPAVTELICRWVAETVRLRTPGNKLVVFAVHYRFRITGRIVNYSVTVTVTEKLDMPLAIQAQLRVTLSQENLGIQVIGDCLGEVMDLTKNQW